MSNSFSSARNPKSVVSRAADASGVGAAHASDRAVLLPDASQPQDVARALSGRRGISARQLRLRLVKPMQAPHSWASVAA
jgi:hypothetical protein